MKQTIKIALLALLSAQAGGARAAQQDYVYTPAAGVHEIKRFHGCFDNTDPGPRPKINVIMKGLSTGDVSIETRPIETGKPSSEIITFRLKHIDASLGVQFRSNDGPHCQQGVQSIAFQDAVLRNANELKAKY